MVTADHGEHTGQHVARDAKDSLGLVGVAGVLPAFDGDEGGFRVFGQLVHQQGFDLHLPVVPHEFEFLRHQLRGSRHGSYQECEFH